MPRTTHILLLCAALAGCAELGLPLKEPIAGPGYFFPASTALRITADPNRIIYEYARMNGSDFPYAIAAAERECKPEGKRAHIASLEVKSQDRGRVTFVCL